MPNLRRIAAWAAVVLFVAAATGALRQPVYPDPYSPRTGLDWWLYPTETNAIWRLPSISVDLNDVAVQRGANGETLIWAVGDSGAIVHSDDGGRCWQAQVPWAPTAATRVCGPTDLTDQLLDDLSDLLPTAQAQEAYSTVAAPDAGKDLTIDPAGSPDTASAPILGLRLGAKSDSVVRLREALAKAGYAPTEPPAEPLVFDQALRDAVVAFQRSRGIAADGLVGPKTWSALVSGGKTSTSRPAASGGDETQAGAVGGGEAALPAPAKPLPPDLLAVSFVDPLTGWAVGSDGAMLATQDGGGTWTVQDKRTNDGLVAVQFTDPETGWAVGAGGFILATRDGGATWKTYDVQRPYTRRPAPQLHAAHFVNAETGWVVGERGDIFATRDGGASWSLQTSNTKETLEAVYGVDAETAWAVGDGGTILATRDGGATWSLQTSNTEARLLAVQFHGTDTGWAIADDGTVLSTTDGGATWGLESGKGRGWVQAASFLDAETGWAVGAKGAVLATRDRGVTWVAQTAGTGPWFLSTQRLDADTGWLVGGHGTILSTHDGGASWATPPDNTDDVLHGVRFVDAETGWVVGSNGTILATRDGGATWHLQDFPATAFIDAVVQVRGRGAGWESQDIRVDTRLMGLDFVDAQTGSVLDESGLVLATADGGASWGISNRSSRTDLYAIQLLDPRTGWLVGAKGTILATRDGGDSWSPQTSNTAEPLLAVHFVDERFGWVVGEKGTILATRDGGSNWSSQTSNTDAALLAVQFVDPEIGWAVGGNGTILATRDGGATWSAQDSSTDKELYATGFVDADTGWAAGEQGIVLATTDGGRTWSSPLAPHRIGPPPWLWLSTGLSLMLLGYTFVPRRPEVTEHRVADLLASDRPLRDRTEADALDLGSIAASLSEFLRNRNTEAPLTIAITGDWGSGKTSLMNLLHRDLADNHFRPVWFNAWHHQKGEQILASLFAHIREQSIPPLVSWRGLRFRWRLLVRRGVPVWLLTILLLVALGISAGYLSDWIEHHAGDIWTILSDPEQLWHAEFQATWLTLSKLAGALAGIAASAFGLMRTMQGFGLDPRRLVTINPQDRKTHGLDPGARSRFTREFRDVTECLKPRKMVIFIDDLDRCGKESLVEVLEAVNFLASSGDCFIVLGMSPRWVEGCVGLAYEDLAKAMAAEYAGTGDAASGDSAEQRRRFARNYLEKLINIEVPIPDLATSAAGKLVAPPDEPAPAVTDWPARWRRGRAVLLALGKPVLVVAALGYGVWFGLDLLHRPEVEKVPPAVNWSTGEVRIAVGQTGTAGKDEDQPTVLDRAAAPGVSDDVKTTTAASGDASGSGADADNEASTGTATAVPAPDLGRTLSELLGVEISIQADPKTLKDGLVLFESGSDDKRWRVVLSEPKPEVAAGAGAGGGPATSQPPEPATESPEKTRRFALEPPLQSQASIASRVLPLVLAALILTAWWGSRRTAGEITEDSSEFRGALAIWLPWLLARQGTPRAVKRFVNRLRYVAIRLREQAGADTAAFPEPSTVALAAIGFFDGTWLSHDSRFRSVVANDLGALIDAEQTVDRASKDTLTARLGDCIERYRAWTSDPQVGEDERRRRGTWPPGEAHREAFLAVLSEQPVAD